MKRFIGLFAFFILLILGGCQNDVLFIDVEADSQAITLRVEEGVLIRYQMSQGYYVEWISEDDTIASILGNLVMAEGEGETIITGQLMKADNDTVFYTTTITVVVLPKLSEVDVPSLELNGPDFAFVGEEIDFTLDITPNEAVDLVVWESSNPQVASVNQLGKVMFLSEGEVTIRAKWLGDTVVVAEVAVNVIFPSNESLEHIVVNPAYQTMSQCEVVFYNNHHYNVGLNAFGTIAEALEVALDSSTIHLAPGTYDEIVRITKSNVRIYGPNVDINPNEDTRTVEAVMTNIITIARGLESIDLRGLAFTDGARVLTLGYVTHFTFRNNYIYDTALASQAWLETADYSGGFMIVAADTQFSNDITLSNNRFTNLGDVALNYSSTHNLKVLNNVFIDFSRDAIRSSTGVVFQNSQWLFRGNHFENSPYNAIFFRTYGPSARMVESIISIFDNTFKNLGNTEVMYSGAISFRNYQEGLVRINISYNVFENCRNYIHLRNNAVAEKQENFVGYINYNVFSGVPNNYYLKNKNATDTVATNPSQINMDYNFFGDASQNPIDFASNQHLFSGASSILHRFISKTALQALPKVYASNVLYLGSSPKMLANGEVTWTTSNHEVATVDTEGVVTTHTLGVVDIIATSKDTSAHQVVFRAEIKPSIYDNYIYHLLAVAIGEEGYREGPNNYSKYGVWYGIPNGAWCAMFVSWCANEVGIPTSIIPKYASVAIGMNWFMERNLFEYKAGYTPKAGDIIFFRDAGASHTGIVIDSDGTRVYTIEGNTSDQVLKRSYLLNHNTITGYGTPLYPPYEGETYIFDISDATDGSGASTR